MLRSLKCWGQRVLQRSFLQLKPLKKVTTAIFIVLHFLYGDKVYPVLAAEIAVNNFVLAAENIPVTILRFKTLLCIIVIGTVTVIIIEVTIIIDPMEAEVTSLSLLPLPLGQNLIRVIITITDPVGINHLMRKLVVKADKDN